MAFINWSEVTAILAVVTGIGGGISWLITRLLIEPMLAKTSQEIKQWITEHYPSRDQFQAHCQIDEARMSELHREIEHLRDDKS